MDGILGRSQFLGETVNFFTDEKTASARARVVEWINELVTADPSTKCDLLVKVQETILSSCVELIDEFLENILSLSHDSNMEVRKQVVIFIEQICRVKVECLPQCVNVISMLLRDRSPQVIKRVIQACGSIYKNGLQWICSQNEVISDSAEQAWSVLSLVKAQILDLIDNDNEGILTNAIKFLEGVVVIQTYRDEDSQKKDNDFSLEDVPENFKIIKRQKLEEEALNIFDVLLKFHAATHITSVNLIICTSSLCTIAKLRPSLMGHVVEALKHLNSNLPPTLTDSQVSSVRKSLKMQSMGILKNRGAYEFQATLRHLLLDLGASSNEIQRAIPKMDKQEQMRRQKRILEQTTNIMNKRMRLGESSVNEEDDIDQTSITFQEKEIDEEELDKQRQKSTRVNEKFIAEHLRQKDLAVSLVIEFLTKLPDEVPPHFLTEYTPIRDLSVPQQITLLSKNLAEQMTASRVGPGAAAFTKEPPMRIVQKKITEGIGEPMEIGKTIEEDQHRKEEATRKLRENMERVKGEQQLIERMKQRAKVLKLQEVTKPFSRPIKEKFLLEAVKRILHAERHAIAGGVSAKRRKLLTIIAATFPDKVRYYIFDFVMLDIRQRIDLAFSWLYEEYCLMQGFTRHSYVKSENSPNYAYNELLSQIITGVREKCELKDKILLLRRIYLEAPLLSEDVINQLVQLCYNEEYGSHGLDLVKDLAILRPPRRNKFLRILLTFTVHEDIMLRERALEHIITLYHIHKILPNRIDEFALEWVNNLDKLAPPTHIFAETYGRQKSECAWNDSLVKICLNLMLTLMPYEPEVYLEKLGEIFNAATPEIKRGVLRSIDSAIKKLGSENAALIKFIESCPAGTEALIIRIIYILTDRIASPPAELVQRVRELNSQKIKDVRVLIPVMSGLTRQEILNALPKMIQLNQIIVKEVFNRLLGIGVEYANQTMATTPTDILVALHTIDLSLCDLKSIVKATSICLAEKDIYTQEVLIGVLQQLVEIVPIPTLLMRTIIQSLSLYPRLSNFILQLLQRLILKQVWRQKVIWDGFLKCIQRLKPQSLAVLLHLPAQQLVSALQQCPDLREPLQEYAESIQDEPMSGITPQIMDIIMGKTVDVFVTDESGGYISVENIKKEIEEPISAIGVLQPAACSIQPVQQSVTVKIPEADQPLPPGED